MSLPAGGGREVLWERTAQKFFPRYIHQNATNIDTVHAPHSMGTGTRVRINSLGARAPIGCATPTVLVFT